MHTAAGKQILVFYFLCAVLAGCYPVRPRDAQGAAAMRPPTNLGLHSGKKKKQLVEPPSGFSNAIFTYREKRNDWPMSLEAVKIIPGFTEALKGLTARGVYQVDFRSMTRDSLVLHFFYSNTLHAREKGRKDNFIVDGMQGDYIFYYNGNVRLFTVNNLR